ncbi:3042_t:CDS:2 [Funneliformis mosseae]|uniref:3042_t:CDS:1 n=1 Tax=Funneliformis mosseae TaxID=27381 RepID=A0A9N9DG70_FUNMO|nr:3042_t:CDS:2 [Funneliformis mosseae]
MYSSLLPSPPFNKFTVFIFYGLLSVALITLAQEDSIGNAKSCIQVTIGYVRLFSTNQPKSTPEIPIPKIQWNNYDYINVIAYPQDNGGDSNYDVGKWQKGPQEQQEYQRIISDAIKIINEYQLNGIDIEYPGMRGSLCKRPDGFIWDKINDENFINFLKNLREALNGTEGPKILMLTTPDDNNYRSYPNSPLDAYQAAYLAYRICTTINPNWTRKFESTDNSGTPWLYSVPDPNVPFNHLYVSYEDISSLRSKLEFALTKSLGGISISDVSYDDNYNNLLNFMQPIRGIPVPIDGGSSKGSPSNKSSNENSNDQNKKNKGGIIAGSIIGGIFGLLLLGSCAYIYRQKVLKSEAGINPEYSSNRVVSTIQNERRTTDHLTIE